MGMKAETCSMAETEMITFLVLKEMISSLVAMGRMIFTVARMMTI